jgi:hypothetical protein
MDALGIALIVIGLALVCGGLIFPRGLSEKPNEESTAIAEFERSQVGSGEIPQGEVACFGNSRTAISVIRGQGFQ